MACEVTDPHLVTALSRRARLAGHLLSATVELTRRCNLRCIMCYASRSPSRPELTDTQVRKVLRELRRCGALFLMLSGGEPLVHPSFFSLLEDAANLGFAVTVLSNASLLDRRACEHLARCARLARVSISLYGTRERTHDSVTRVRGSFERARRAAAHLAELGVDVMLKFLVMRPNVPEIDDIPKFARKMGLPFQIDTTVTARDNGDRTPLKLRASEDAIVRAFRMAREEQARLVPPQERDDEGELASRFPEEPPLPHLRAADVTSERQYAETRRSEPLCSAGTCYCVVNAYGDCCPCPQIPIPQGNVTRSPLAKIWRKGKLFRELRALRESHLQACRACAIAKHCHRCPGLALMETGSLYLPCETACLEARAWQRASER